MALNNADLFLVNQGGESKKITYQNLKSNILDNRTDDENPIAGFRNVLINGNLAINQRNVTYAAAAVGEYWADRWKKTAGGMTQIVEAGNFKPSTVHTLSGTNVTTQQITSPAAGNWTIPNVPSNATDIQLEPGSVATPFELRPIGLELSLCQRYFVRQDYGPKASVLFSLPYLQWTAFAGGTVDYQAQRSLPSMRAVPVIEGSSDFGFSAGVGGTIQRITGDADTPYVRIGASRSGVDNLQGTLAVGFGGFLDISAEL